jgi:hypothetical protein
MSTIFDQEITLESNQVQLVPFSAAFKESLLEIAIDSSIWTYMGHSIQTEKELDDYIEATLNVNPTISLKVIWISMMTLNHMIGNMNNI